MSRRFMAGWAAPASLLALGALPILTGSLTLAGIATGLSEGDPGPGIRDVYVARPLPILAHIVAGLVVTVLGALQFAPGLGLPRGRWHRVAGRAFVAAALVLAATAVHMNAAFPAFGGPTKESARLVFGLAQGAFVLLGLEAILCGDVARHRAWMIRAYATALGVGTQSLVLLPIYAVAGLPPNPWLGLALWACWLLNLGVAEAVIRRGRAFTPATARQAPA